MQHNQMESSMPATLAISYEQFLPSLQKSYFNEQIGGALQREPGFGELPSGSDQISFVNEFSRRELN
jgi:hypothetical protein